MYDLYIRPRLRPIGKGALTGKLVLVTGASRGIGAATARVLAEAGAQVILNYHSKGSRAEKVAALISSPTLGTVASPNGLPRWQS